ncbi:MAG TPA: hypothetical protein PKZ07_14625 [Sedimentisphaerales bacterium]|nr:hypothetical protein [Sedimentisphaerales bacterium]
MIIVEQDFFTNITGTGFGQNPEQDRMVVLHRIAKLIATNRAGVIEAIRASGVAIPHRATDKVIVNKIVDNIATNQRMVTAISYLIAQDDNLLIDGPQFYATEGGGDQEKSGSGGGVSIMDPISTVVSGIGTAINGIFGAKAAKENRKAQEDRNRTELLLAILANKGGAGKSDKTATVVLIVLGVVTAAVIGYIAYQNRDQK